LDQLSDDSWNTRLNTPLGPLPAAVLVLARLNEVALHHVDLDLGRKLSDLDPALTALLLTWNARRLSPRLRHYRLHLMADEGVDLTLGDGDWTAEVRGSQASLLGWITGRRDSTAVLGAEAIDLGGPV
ncbi:MAG: hypothetical protein LBL92_07020, partial [Propionibacteriaceae bacterium]|nr:hypothetical protein [Propionibacteriaceae bacterium]